MEIMCVMCENSLEAKKPWSLLRGFAYGFVWEPCRRNDHWGYCRWKVSSYNNSKNDHVSKSGSGSVVIHSLKMH